MDITHTFDAKLAIDTITKNQPALVTVDGNLSEDALTALVHHCVSHDIQIFFEPTSIVKSTRILPGVARSLGISNLDKSPVAFTSPNMLELARMHQAASTPPLELTSNDFWWSVVDALALGSQFRMQLEQLARMDACEQTKTKGTLSFLVDKGIAQMSVQLLPFFQHMIIKCGHLGIVTVFRVPNTSSTGWAHEQTNIKARQVISHSGSDHCVVLKHFPAIPLDMSQVVNVTGAGDSLVGSVLSTLIRIPEVFKDPELLDQMVRDAQQAAVMTLQSSQAVSPGLSIHK